MEWIDPVLGHLDEHKQCTYCNGFYGSCHGQPVCSTCHLFLFAFEPGEFERVPASEEDDTRDEQQSLDSGNEEPTDPDLVDESSGEMGDERSAYMGNGINSRGGRSRDFVLLNPSLEHVNPGDVLAAPDPQDQLNKRVRALSQYRPLSSLSSHSNPPASSSLTGQTSSHTSSRATNNNNNNISGSNLSHEIHSSLSSLPSLAQCSSFPTTNLSSSTSHSPSLPIASRVPEEIFVSKIFPLLDDMQLFMCSRVCRRWRRIVLSLDLPWERFVRNRWPMFAPQFKINDWYETYSRLMDSMCCHRCFWSISHFTQTRNRRSRSFVNPSVVTAERLAGTATLDQFSSTGIYPQAGGVQPVPTSRGWSTPNAVNYHHHPSTGAVHHVRGVGVAPPAGGAGDARLDLLPRGGGGTGGNNDVTVGMGVADDRDGDCWRNRRLQSEFHNLKCDPFLGLNAVKLDPAGYTWQASVEGPMGSPYEGGIFFISMFIPENYPLKAPTVRFQTKILHPNISVHGDIGMESIGGVNWIPTLTLSKVLLSILSLLTDPNCEISMNAEAAYLYRSDRNRFNRMAKLTTYKYAMIDYMQCSSYQQQPIISPLLPGAQSSYHSRPYYSPVTGASTAVASQSAILPNFFINVQYPHHQQSRPSIISAATEHGSPLLHDGSLSRANGPHSQEQSTATTSAHRPRKRNEQSNQASKPNCTSAFRNSGFDFG